MECSNAEHELLDALRAVFGRSNGFDSCTVMSAARDSTPLTPVCAWRSTCCCPMAATGRAVFAGPSKRARSIVCCGAWPGAACFRLTLSAGCLFPELNENIMSESRSLFQLSDTAKAAVDVDKFIENLTAGPSGSGRLIFALDATASRQATWDSAVQLQGEMFREAAAIGGLRLQLVAYRGFDECMTSGWVSNSKHLLQLMGTISCSAGTTQISRVLRHAQREAAKEPVAALDFHWRRDGGKRRRACVLRARARVVTSKSNPSSATSPNIPAALTGVSKPARPSNWASFSGRWRCSRPAA